MTHNITIVTICWQLVAIAIVEHQILICVTDTHIIVPMSVSFELHISLWLLIQIT